MQLSDREIQNTLDMLKKQQGMGEEHAPVLTDEEIEGVREVVKRIGEHEPEVRQDLVDKLKKALETSSYNVTGDDVAKKLIGRIITDKIR